MPRSAAAHLYQRIADDLGTAVRSGTYLPGDRMPSLRQLSRRLGVSVATVTQAYQWLERQGLLEARPQSGFYVRARSQPREPRISRPRVRPVPVTTGELLRELLDFEDQGADGSVIDLATAAPMPGQLPTRAINHALAGVARSGPHLGSRYEVPEGRPELRLQIARLMLTAGVQTDPGEVIVTGGCQEALTLALRAVAEPGDTIAVESPTYHGLLQAIEALGMHALEVPTHPQDGVCLDSLEQAMTRWTVKACLFVTNHGNPLGGCMPDSNKQRLVEMLDRSGTPLIEDDVYGDLHFHGSRPRTCKHYDRHGRVLLCSSFSKTLGPGYRIGWCLPGRYADRMRHLKFLTNISSSPLLQLAVARFLAGGRYERHTRSMRAAYARQTELMIRTVEAAFPAGTRVTHPRGGSVLWLELPADCDTLTLYERARAHGIRFAPGLLFSAQQRYRNCLRLSCAHPWSDRLEAALVTLGRLAGELVSEGRGAA